MARFTVLSDSELPSSMVTGVVYLSLMKLISAVWVICRSYMGGGSLMELSGFLLD